MKTLSKFCKTILPTTAMMVMLMAGTVQANTHTAAADSGDTQVEILAEAESEVAAEAGNALKPSQRQGKPGL